MSVYDRIRKYKEAATHMPSQIKTDLANSIAGVYFDAWDLHGRPGEEQALDDAFKNAPAGVSRQDYFADPAVLRSAQSNAIQAWASVPANRSFVQNQPAKGWLPWLQTYDPKVQPNASWGKSQYTLNPEIPGAVTRTAQELKGAANIGQVESILARSAIIPNLGLARGRGDKFPDPEAGLASVDTAILGIYENLPGWNPERSGSFDAWAIGNVAIGATRAAERAKLRQMPFGTVSLEALEAARESGFELGENELDLGLRPDSFPSEYAPNELAEMAEGRVPRALVDVKQLGKGGDLLITRTRPESFDNWEPSAERRSYTNYANAIIAGATAQPSFNYLKMEDFFTRGLLSDEANAPETKRGPVPRVGWIAQASDPDIRSADQIRIAPTLFDRLMTIDDQRHAARMVEQAGREAAYDLTHTASRETVANLIRGVKGSHRTRLLPAFDENGKPVFKPVFSRPDRQNMFPMPLYGSGGYIEQAPYTMSVTPGPEETRVSGSGPRAAVQGVRPLPVVQTSRVNSWGLHRGAIWETYEVPSGMPTRHEPVVPATGSQGVRMYQNFTPEGQGRQFSQAPGGMQVAVNENMLLQLSGHLPMSEDTQKALALADRQSVRQAAVQAAETPFTGYFGTRDNGMQFVRWGSRIDQRARRGDIIKTKDGFGVITRGRKWAGSESGGAYEAEFRPIGPDLDSLEIPSERGRSLPSKQMRDVARMYVFGMQGGGFDLTDDISNDPGLQALDAEAAPQHRYQLAYRSEVVEPEGGFSPGYWAALGRDRFEYRDVPSVDFQGKYGDLDPEMTVPETMGALRGSAAGSEQMPVVPGFAPVDALSGGRAMNPDDLSLTPLYENIDLTQYLGGNLPYPITPGQLEDLKAKRSGWMVRPQAREVGRYLMTAGYNTDGEVMPVGDYIANLKKNGVQAVLDVRSWPNSKKAPDYNRGKIQAALKAAGIQYHGLNM